MQSTTNENTIISSLYKIDSNYVAPKLLFSFYKIDPSYFVPESVDYDDFRVIGNEKAYKEIYIFIMNFMETIHYTKNDVDFNFQSEELKQIVLSNNLSMKHLYNRFFYNWLNAYPLSMVMYNHFTSFDKLYTIYLMMLIRSYYYPDEIEFFKEFVSITRKNVSNMDDITCFLNKKKTFDVEAYDCDEYL